VKPRDTGNVVNLIDALAAGVGGERFALR